MFSFYRNLKNIYNFNLYSIESWWWDYEKTDSQKISPDNDSLNELSDLSNKVIENSDNKEEAQKLKVMQEMEVSELEYKKNEETRNIVDETVKESRELQLNLTEENNVNILDRFWRMRDRNDMWSDVNKNSLKNILSWKNGDINQIYTEMTPLIQKMEEKVTFTNFRDLRDFLKNNVWYVPDWAFWPWEAEAVYWLITDTKLTQDKFSWNLDYGEKIKILIDFDSSWTIDSDIRFNSSEISALEHLSDKKQYENLLNNLWLDFSSFNDSLSKNYFQAREDLKQSIARFSEMDGTSLRQLLLSKEEFDKSMDFLVKNKYISTELNKQFDNLAKQWINVSDEVIRDAITIIWGAVNGWWYTTDTIWKKVSEITWWVLENFSVWFADWKIWLVIWWGKELFNWTTVSWWVANFIPFASIDQELFNTSEASIWDVFQNKMDWWTKVSINWVITPVIIWWGLNIQRVNEYTWEWLRQMTTKMSWVIDKMMEDPNISFSEFLDANKWEIEKYWKIDDKWIQNLKNFYEWLQLNFNSFWKNNPIEFRNWVLRAYQNELYSNAEWISFSGVNISVFGPIIIWGLSFDKISQSYDKKDTSFVDSYIDGADLWYKEAVNKLKSFNENAIDSVSKFKQKISEIINLKTIKNLEKSLEWELHNFLNWKLDLGKTWNNFTSEMWKLWKDISFLWTPDDSEKILILQNIAINMMKKENLSIDDNWNINLDWNISSYDIKNNRASYFDRIFSKELSWISSEIKSARKEFYEKFWDVNSYELWQVPIDGWIWFTWVRIWPDGKWWYDALNPYVAGSIAAKGWEAMKIPMNLNDKWFYQMVDKLPNHLVVPLISQLEALGYNFPEGDKISNMKNILKNGWVDGIKIGKNAYFAKAAECLNDTVFMDFSITYNEKIVKPGAWDTFVANNIENKINVWISARKQKEENKGGENQKEENEGGEESKTQIEEPVKTPIEEPSKTPTGETPKTPATSELKVNWSTVTGTDITNSSIEWMKASAVNSNTNNSFSAKNSPGIWKGKGKGK